MPPETAIQDIDLGEQPQVSGEEIESLKELRRRVTSPIVSLNDTAEILGVTRRTVYRRINDGDLIAVQLWDRTFVRRDSLVAYLVRLSDEVSAALAAVDPHAAA